MAVIEYLFGAVRDGVHKVSIVWDSLHAGSISFPDKMPSSISSLRSFTKLVLGSAQVALLSTSNGVLGGVPASCPNPQLSCSSTTPVSNTCCYNSPGGLILQTQFWDTKPATGPVDHWTVHGLWPDNCDGTYEQYCDVNREYTNITAILSSYGASNLLSYMGTYWKDYQGNDESFWEHEWNKHGTCISTLETKCYTGYTPQEEVLDYFNTTVNLFKTLDSYSFLAAAGILPSTTQTYTAAQIQAALTRPRGHSAIIQCNNGELDEIWYFYNLAGSVQTGQFVATDPVGTSSDCPATGIKYLPKVPSTGPTPTTTLRTSAAPSPTASGAPFSGKGYLMVETGGKQTGCIISGGTWYTTGTCATFTAAPSGTGITLTSSKGKCAVVSAVLTCATTVSTAGIFTNVGGKLASSGSTAFYAKGVAAGSTQQTVYTTQQATGLTISWKAV